MRSIQVLCSFVLACNVLACDPHATGKILAYSKRDGENGDAADGPIPSAPKYDYSASWDWANLDPAFGLCQNGTQQSPIGLSTSQGLSKTHIPTFNYPSQTAGNFKNWGFGPAFDVVYEEGNITGNPSISFDDETAYLVGWHIHTPADHSVDGYHSRAELHFVHQGSNSVERAVVAMLMEPSPDANKTDPFIQSLPQPFVKFNATNPDNSVPVSVDLNLALASVGNFQEFWTYEGSLTSPPCSEGLRWFVAAKTMYVGRDQMTMLLDTSKFSSRAEQMVWEHRINE